MTKIFKDLKVIELANVLAGPSVGMFFAELGARVIKIENKLTHGDITRGWKLPSEPLDSEISAYFASVNWKKKSIFLDLTNSVDKKKVLKLIADADILISNYKSGDDRKLGVDYKSIKKINPSIIYGHITGFGKDSNRVAYDLVLQAEAGFMSMNGTRESGPLKMPVAFIDLFAAHQMKEAILVGLINKLKTGKGGYYSVSLYDSAVASLANQASNFLMAGHIQGLEGSLHPNIAPYGEIVTTKDRKKIVLAIGNDKQFKNLCLALEAPEIFEDKRFDNNVNRIKFRADLYKILQESFFKLSSKTILPVLHRKNVPAGEVKNISEVLKSKEAKKLILKEKEAKIIRSLVFEQDE